MSKESIAKSNMDVSKESYYYPEDEVNKMENHILGESFNMDLPRYDKIQHQAAKLESMVKQRQEQERSGK